MTDHALGRSSIQCSIVKRWDRFKHINRTPRIDKVALMMDYLVIVDRSNRISKTIVL